MSFEKMHFRHCMLYKFRPGKNATKGTETNCSVYDLNVLNVTLC